MTESQTRIGKVRPFGWFVLEWIFIPFHEVHFQLSISGNKVDDSKEDLKVISTMYKSVKRKHRGNNTSEVIVALLEGKTNELKFHGLFVCLASSDFFVWGMILGPICYK